MTGAAPPPLNMPVAESARLGTLGVNAVRYSTQRTGVGRYIEFLLREFARQPHRFDAIRVYAPPGSPALACAETGRLRPVALGPRLPDLAWETLRLAPRARHDTLLFCPSYTVPPGYRGRAVVSNLGIYEAFRGTFGRWRFLRHSLHHRWSVHAADRVIANSQSTKHDLVRHYGIAPEKVAVIYPGKDERFRPPTSPAEGRAIRAKLGLGDAPYLLFVGKLSLRRNVGLLLEALARVRHAVHHNLRLVVVGPDVHGFDLPARVAASGLGNAVSYLPFLPHDDLIPLYGAAEAFVLPTVHEGFSFTILEALACGCPVITFPHAALEGGVEDAVHLAPVPTADALTNAIDAVAGSPTLRADLRARGLACSARFSWRRNAEETLRLLEMVASG